MHLLTSHPELPTLLPVLLNAGANIDARSNFGDTPLISMVQFGFLGADLAMALQYTQLLLEAVADIDITNDSGETALMIAVSNGFPWELRLSELLLSAGAG